MLATGRSPAAADAGAKDPNGTARTGSHLQAAEAQPVLTQPDDKSSAIAELQAFRPPAAPWQIRYRKHIVAGMAVVATVGASVLGVQLWRTLGPSRLDEVKVELPGQRNILPQDATPAPSPAAPKATLAVDVPQKRSDPIATGSRPRPGGSASVVTHTKGGASAPRQEPRVRVQEQRPVTPVQCSEAVAALNLCAPTSSNKAAQ